MDANMPGITPVSYGGQMPYADHSAALLGMLHDMLVARGVYGRTVGTNQYHIAPNQSEVGVIRAGTGNYSPTLGPM